MEAIDKLGNFGPNRYGLHEEDLDRSRGKLSHRVGRNLRTSA